MMAGAVCVAQPAGSGVDVDRLIQGIQAAESRIRSARCTITVSAKNMDVRLKDKNGVPALLMPEHMVTVVATRGQKSYWEDVTVRNAPVAFRTIHDGKQTYDIFVPKRPDSGQPTMWVPSRAGAQGMKEWMYEVLGKNILDLLRHHQYDTLEASSSSDFGPVFTVTFDPRNHLGTPDLKTASVDIAPAYGYAIVRVRTNGLVTQEITGFTRKQGIALPSRARRLWYVHSRPSREETITFTDREVNNVPDSLFEVNIKPGDILQVDGTRYIIGPHGERIFQWSDKSGPARKASLGWLFIASLTGTVMLGLAVMLRRRRMVRMR
jgi:hypothetical protein